MRHHRLIKLAFLFAVLNSCRIFAQGNGGMNASEIQLALKKLGAVGSVLYIAAHPDDENTRLLSYLSSEELVRTGYLSLTRGDGGQNLIGTEQGEQLGMIRTQELLAARKKDGAEQFFTRANDFGFSKNPQETFSIWDKEKILSDVVWTIRNFRPDVIIARFPTNGDGGHGHHTASAILAEEAFDAAADPTRFPEQLKYVKPWKAKRLMWNNFIRDPKTADYTGLLKLDIGLYNPLLGKSYGEIAAESRTMHKSQGFGVPANLGQVTEYFKFIKGEKAVNDLFEGIDMSWSRIKGAEKISQMIVEAYREYLPETPYKIIPKLLEIYNGLDAIEDEYWKVQKKKEVENLILSCAGVSAEAVADDFTTTPGAKMTFTVSVVKRSDAEISLKKVAFILPEDTLTNKSLNKYEIFSFKKSITLPGNIPYSDPYWLQKKHAQDMYQVDDELLIGKPENSPPLNVQLSFSFGASTLTVSRPIKYKWTDPVEGEQSRQIEIVPPVLANISEHLYVFKDDKTQQVNVTLKSAASTISGELRLQVPEGWKVEPAVIPFSFKNKGDEQAAVFAVTPPQNKQPNSVSSFKAVATIGDQNFSKGIIHIKHNHIPIQFLLPEAEGKFVLLDLAEKNIRIGYIPGAVDEVMNCLKKIGFDVTELNDEMIDKQDLSKYDAIVTGIRAYNTNERMRFHYKKLMEYISSGGNLIVQYNTKNFLSTIKSDIGPYPFQLSSDRVTVEQAPMTFDLPDHPVLNKPNKITQKDFDGWIQERGLYFASDWDPKYETIFTCNDPGEKPLKGSTLVAKYGKGYFVYTGLSFFRELPAGVPGAYRLFVNMVSLGK